MTAYYLDDDLSLSESTCRFPPDDHGPESIEEGFFVVAIRRAGSRECVFRFSDADRDGARSTLVALNRDTARQRRAPGASGRGRSGRNLVTSGRGARRL